MHISKRIFYVSVMALMFVSCKNDPKEETTVSETTTTQKVSKKILTEEDKKVLGSVLVKIMTAPELKSFSSACVTVQVTDLLSKEQGPFTVLGPTNAAFEVIPKATMTPFLKPQNKANFEKLIKNHIVKGNFSSEVLLKQIEKNGSLELETLGGAKLMATQSGNDIIITDANGKKATLHAKNMEGGNGWVHTLDAVLNIK
ncbi:MAG: fasciclin domain-containing protein [Flavobacteriaceae bacterium]|nr:fasciclin domain-containing protein [Flavobacteriaceae bacterium]